MITVDKRPVNGVDLSHWNADPFSLINQPWVEFFGHKATHPNGKGMINGTDPKLPSRRIMAHDLDIRWRAFFSWVVPMEIARPAEQVELLYRTIGDLQVGESVYLDWEDDTVPLTVIEELTIYMDLVYPGRWFMYLNDATPDMTAWLQDNKLSEAVPVMHPNHNIDIGLFEARKWNSMIWQTGVGLPPGFANKVPMDFVLQPVLLDWVCGRV
jgi:hypothetical protein